MAQRPTIYDVAESAGVSISTVSLALNAPRRVKAETLERIHASIDELGFVPKTEAISRARRGVGRIGVVAPFVAYSSFSRRLNGALKAIRGESFEIVVYDYESAPTSFVPALPLTGRLDGLVVMSLPLSDQAVNRIRERELPTVLIELTHPGFSAVTLDNEGGGRMVAELLVGQGHRRLGYIGEIIPPPLDPSFQAEARFRGFREALARHDVQLDEANVRHVVHGTAAAAAATADILDGQNPPTAIFAQDDTLAGAVLKAARARGVQIPEDLAVVGFDDGEIAEPLGLTTVRQPLEDSGRVAIETLLAELKDHSRTRQQIELQLSIVERETTRAGAGP